MGLYKDAAVHAQALALRRVASDAAAIVHQALGVDDASVRVALPDAAGRLRVVAAHGPSGRSGRRRSSRRREVFETGRDLAIVIGQDGSRSLSIVPLMAEDEPVGVLEVVAPRERIAGRHQAILALVRQSSALMKVSQDRVEQERSTEGMERLLRLAVSLEGAQGPVAAMGALVDACWEHLAVPVVVTRPDRDGDGWFLAAAAGLGTRKRTQLRRTLRSLPQGGHTEDQDRAVSAAFRRVVGRVVLTLPAGDAFVLVATHEQQSGFVRVAALMLARTLEYLTGHGGRGGDVGMGIAWTAHELRGPLAGARAALDYILSGQNGVDRLDLLRRTRAELEQLTDLVDPLLEWSAGRSCLRPSRADLVQIVREAVASSTLDAEDDRITIEAPQRLPIRADVAQLRAAIANVVRNALAYSPRSTHVRIEVADHGAFARVYVRDQGPGIRPDERRALFDPFVRGAQARNVRSGKGLGLFIARRVTEAHGGAFRLEPGTVGAGFYFELPVRGERRRVG